MAIKETTSPHKAQKVVFDIGDYQILDSMQIRLYLNVALGHAMRNNPKEAIQISKIITSLYDERYNRDVHPEPIIKANFLELLKIVLDKYNPSTVIIDSQVLERFKNYRSMLFGEFKDVMNIVYSNILNPETEDIFSLFKKELTTISEEKLKTHYFNMLIGYICLPEDQKSIIIAGDETGKRMFKNKEGKVNGVITDSLKRSVILDGNAIRENIASWQPADLESKLNIFDEALKEIEAQGGFISEGKLEINSGLLPELDRAAATRKIYNVRVVASQLSCTTILNFMKGPLAYDIKDKGELESLKEIARSFLLTYNSNKDTTDMSTDIGPSHLPDINDTKAVSLQKIQPYLAPGLAKLRAEMLYSMDDIVSSDDFKTIFDRVYGFVDFNNSFDSIKKEEQVLIEPAVKRMIFLGMIEGGSALTYLNSMMVQAKAQKTGYGKAHSSLLHTIETTRIEDYQKLRNQCIILSSL